MRLTGVANAIRTAAVKLSVGVSVRPLGTELSAQDERIAASIVASRIEAGFSPLRVDAAIVVSPIQLAYALGQWLSHYRYQDQMGVLEKALLAFFKTQTENLALAEDVSFAFYKNLNETLGLADKQIFSIFKVLVEQPLVLDQYRMLFSRGVSDQGTIRDWNFKWNLSKQPVETFVVLDFKAISLTRLRYEAASASELSTRQFGKNTYETPKVVDSKTTAISKSLTDPVTATDDVDGAASILDDQEMQFLEMVSRIVGVADSETISIQSSKTESALISDTGSLRSQGYCDFTYFAEDFVGASRTF